MAQVTQVTQVTQVNQLTQPPLCSCPGLPYRLHGITTPQMEVMTPPANRLIDLLTAHDPVFEQTHLIQDSVIFALTVGVCLLPVV